MKIFFISTDIYEYNYYTSFNSNKTFTLVGKDEKDKTASSTIRITYYNRVYWGVSNLITYDNNFLREKLANSTLSDNKNRTIQVNATEGQYIYYALPSRLGTPMFKVNGFEGGFEKVSTISFTNNYGFTEDYDIYKSDNANLGNTTVVIS